MNINQLPPPCNIKLFAGSHVKYAPVVCKTGSKGQNLHDQVDGSSESKGCFISVCLRIIKRIKLYIFKKRVNFKLCSSYSRKNATVFVSFADSNWRASSKPLSRIGREAERMRCFEKIYLYTEHDFSEDYTTQNSVLFSERGFGYWQWKSYIILRELQQMDDGDVLLFCDAGCHLNILGRKKMLAYINMLLTSEYSILSFEQGLPECQWTKGDLFYYFGINPIDYCHNQSVGGILFVKNDSNGRSVISDWYDICHKHHELITDSQSKMPNHPLFIENRHDQSALSLLLHIRYSYCTKFLPADLIYSEKWDNLIGEPIWACRNHVKEAKEDIFSSKLPHVFHLYCLVKRYYRKLKLS